MSSNVAADRMVTACVLIIGNEILSGRTQDANLSHIAISLNQVGVQVREARVIPDIESEIVQALNLCRERYDYVFTTGGIGPTHDDITAECVAKAFGRELYMHPEIAAVLRRREAPPDAMASRLRMAMVPRGAVLIDNPFGPHGFRIENVYVMAGIPRVMQAMLEAVAPELDGGYTVHSRSLSAYVTESQIAKPLGKLQDKQPGVDIGSYPFARDGRFGTSLVVRGPDEAVLETLLATMGDMVVKLGGEIAED
jgi:molybdenum cofactor synthesis domain-containing protein